MNINMKAVKPPAKKTYKKTDKLKPNAFYDDDDGGLVITNYSGNPVVVFCFGEAFASYHIAWPLKDTDVTSVTVSQ